MSYVLIAFLSLGAFSVYNVLQKITVKYVVADTFIFSFYYYLTAILFFVPFIFLGKVVGLNSTQLPLVAAAGLIRSFMFVIYLWVFKKLDVTVISSMFNLRVILVALSEVIWLGTVFSGWDYAWMIILFVGGVFLSMDESFSWRSFFNPVMAVFGVVLLLSTIQFVAINRGMAVTDFWTFNFWSYVFSLVGLLPLLWWQKKSLPLPLKEVGVISAVASTALVGVLLESLAVAANPTGSTAIFSLPGSMILAMILSIFKPGLIESHPVKVYALRLVSAAVMGVAVWQLVG
jgi:hypothetical protein